MGHGAARAPATKAGRTARGNFILASSKQKANYGVELQERRLAAAKSRGKKADYMARAREWIVSQLVNMNRSA